MIIYQNQIKDRDVEIRDLKKQLENLKNNQRNEENSLNLNMKINETSQAFVFILLYLKKHFSERYKKITTIFKSYLNQIPLIPSYVLSFYTKLVNR